MQDNEDGSRQIWLESCQDLLEWRCRARRATDDDDVAVAHGTSLSLLRLHKTAPGPYVPTYLPDTGGNMAVSPTLSQAQPPLSGRRVLVVEDEYFLADDMSRALRSYG